MNGLLPNNREFAVLLWIAVALVFVLPSPIVRGSVRDLLRSALHAKILLPILAMFLYMAVAVSLGFRLRIWRSDLLKPSLLWVSSTGVWALLKFDEASREPHFFRRSVRATLRITAFLEFFLNAAPMNLIVEVLLQPFVVVLAVISAWPTHQKQYREIGKTANILLALIGFSLLGHTTRTLYSTWDRVDKQGMLLQLALPLWLTVSLLPFVYGLSLLAEYEKAFSEIDRAATTGYSQWRAKLALLTGLHVRTRGVRQFVWPWTEKIAAADSFSAARRVVAAYWKSKRERRSQG